MTLVLWSESNDTGEGFHCIRMVNNIHLNFDAFHGVDHGDVHDGTIVVYIYINPLNKLCHAFLFMIMRFIHKLSTLFSEVFELDVVVFGLVCEFGL